MRGEERVSGRKSHGGFDEFLNGGDSEECNTERYITEQTLDRKQKWIVVKNNGTAEKFSNAAGHFRSPHNRT
jgi:hypothetical protein